MILRGTDVCVVGGGAAGMAAACSAARRGTDVILVERYGFLGGMGTGAIIGTFCGLYTSGARPRPLTTWFGWAIVAELLRRRAAYRFPFGNTLLVHYDSEVLKRVYDDLASRSGVKVLLHALSTDPQVEGRRVRSIDVRTRGDTIRIEAAVFVDASGDADLCHRAGAATELGDELGRLQPATLVFRVAGVDTGRAATLSRAELNQRMREDAAAGRYALPRTNGSFYPTTHPGEVVVNMTRIMGLNGVDPDDLTRGEMEGRRQIEEYMCWLVERVPGFEQAYVSAVGVQLGIRETRRVVGCARLDGDHLRRGCVGRSDVGEGAWPFEVHRADGDGTRLEWLPDGTAYGVPLEAATPRDLDNVLVAGRCLSTTSEAHASTRVMGTCFSVGEGVGSVAAHVSRDGGDITGSEFGFLQDMTAWRNESTEPADIAWPAGAWR